MRRYIFLFILIFGFSLFVFAEEDDFLKIEASVNPKMLYRGQKGKIVLKLTLEEGIFIIPQPSFIIEFDSSKELSFLKNIFNASDLELEILEENGEEYLNMKEPIEIPFIVRMEAKRGNHLLEGKIKYFACSKEEGWCLKSSSMFRATFYTRRAKFNIK